jgi:hypothetical protein
MKRILQVELNDKYFDLYGAAFFKSFYTYNKGWDLYVSDLGLRDDQREILSRYGTVEKYEATKVRRWIQIPARLATFAKIVRNGDLVLHSDVDLVVLDSYEDLVQELLDGKYSCLGSAWPAPVSVFMRNQQKAADMLGVRPISTLFSADRIHLGWLLMHGTPEVAAALEWLHENWEEFSIYAGEEETALTCIFRRYGLRVKHDPFIDCTAFNFPNSGSLMPSWSPCAWFGAHPSRLVHFATTKYYMDQTSSGNSHECAMAWKDVLMGPYADMPWPAPEEVCESRRDNYDHTAEG